MRFGIAAILALGLLLALPPSAAPAKPKTDSGPAVHHDTSPALRDIAPATDDGKKEKKEKEKGHLPLVASHGTDTAVQSSQGTASAPATSTNFDGVGEPNVSVNVAPPDTDGDVGPNHYVQIVNLSFAVFSKTGSFIYGPALTKTLWSGFGGGCQSNNDGDGTVKYDKSADRWIITQFSVSTTPYLECVAVSTTGDPTGTYYRYAFSYSNFPDYPKLGVWSDAYYITFNLFNSSGTSFLGSEICAYDRSKMLIGAVATQQCKTTSSTYGGLLPSDIDGSTAPPAGSPNYILNVTANTLNLWKFHVDWATPANTTFAGPSAIGVAGFSEACGGGACIPQSGAFSGSLDSLGDRLMYRLAYRNFGDHESLVVNHSVTAGSSVGVRWYELRSPGSAPSVYQQGTYAPDSSYRWMGSAAMDHSGNVGLGYSVSSSSMHPGIRYTGHVTTDPLGVMGQGEGTLINGGGSQDFTLDRWGDYASMSVDPTDDCTFWFTSEYLKSDGSFNWSTRIGSFKFASCSTQTTPDFSLTASPSSQTVTQGGSTSYNVSVNPQNGFNGSVALSVSGLPANASGSFSPNPATSASTLSVATSASTPAGTYPLTITGTSGSLTHSTSVSLIVNATAQPDFTLSASPGSQTVVAGSSTTYVITVNGTNGFAGSVTLSLTGLPAGTSYSFGPNPTSASSTLTITTTSGSKPSTSTLTIAGTSGSLTRTTTVSLRIKKR
ncbi:MAG: hypothetical protein ABR548_00420 [Actinomycetota bacterium]|nr:hypothetical protein [Actinomycetota bacterium]